VTKHLRFFLRRRTLLLSKGIFSAHNFHASAYRKESQVTNLLPFTIITMFSRPLASSVARLALKPKSTTIPSSQHPSLRLLSSVVVPSPRRQEQQDLFDYYIQNKAGATDLFHSLDLNYDEKISVKEIQYFLDSLDTTASSTSSLKTLIELGEDHELSQNEFEMWLSTATRGDSSADDNKSSADAGASSTGTKRNLRTLLWDRWLATGQNASELFHAIDLDHSETISVNEINSFLDMIEYRGLDMDDVEELLQLGRDHQLSPDEFQVWLAGATEPQVHASDNRNGAAGCAPAHQ
jgi:Ca2+-binding EF-hand superfamily protein